jgi:cold shock CspA family protein
MQGSIIRWNDDRGFGFISSTEIKGDVFAHISQFKEGHHRPKIGDAVLFQIVNENGKQSAKSISLIGIKPKPQNKQSLTSKLFSFLIVILIAFVVYTFIIKPKLYPAYEEMGFSCEGN